jgi:prophage regulatory protein
MQISNESAKLLRLKDVSELTSLGKSTINLWVAQGKFPKPLTLSVTIKVWRLKDVVDWIEQHFSAVTDNNKVDKSNIHPS